MVVSGCCLSNRFLTDFKRGPGHRKKLLCVWIILSISIFVWLCYGGRRTSIEPTLQHLRKDRNLTHYMSSIPLLTEPFSTPCDSLNDIPLLVMVASSPSRFEHRDVIRTTWGQHVPTYFLLGLSDRRADLAILDLEAYQYNDLIVYDFQDHYQNLTLKTALMLRWTQNRCGSVGFLMKTDDDVLVNPWITSELVNENIDAQLIGYKYYNVWPYRGEYDKWYLPRWLYQPDFVPQYLLGAAYLIKGKYVKAILDAAAEVPLINIEDIYFTYLVASAKLGLELTHDDRLSPYRHWLLLPCIYWPFAISHDLDLEQTVKVWQGLVRIATEYDHNKEICTFYIKLMRLFTGSKS